MLFTKTQAAQLPTLMAAEESEVGPLLSEVAKLVATVDDQPYADPADLRSAWSSGAAAFDAALALASEMGLVMALPDVPPAVRILLPAPQSATDLNSLGKDDLATLARIYEVDGRSKMDAEELRGALARVAAAPAFPVVQPAPEQQPAAPVLGFPPPGELAPEAGEVG